MGQHRPFGNTGGAAGVLQESDVILIQRHRFPAVTLARGKCRLEVDGTGQLPRRHQLLHMAHDEIDQQPLEAEQFAHRRDHHVLDRCPGNGLLQGMGEILDDNDGRRPGILQLVFQFARRVQGIAVNHNTTGTQRPE